MRCHFEKFRSLIFIALFFCGGCQYFIPEPPCPPPPSARALNTNTYLCTNPTVSPVIPAPDEFLNLASLIDIALLNSPKTRILWFQAKQRATELGIARGAYLPPLNFRAYWLTTQFPLIAIDDQKIDHFRLTSALFYTDYLLFDFGGRNGNVGAASMALEGANWAYNWEVQSVIIYVIQSYYDYLNACAILQADMATVQDNEKTLEATVALKLGGIATLSDELQSKTALVQSRISLEQDQGILNVTRATLVQSLGIPPDTPICLGELPDDIETECVCQDMATLLQLAKERRADLKALRARILQNRFRIRTARAAMLPTVDMHLDFGKQAFNDHMFMDAHKLQFNLNVPFFNSFANINLLRRAQAQLLESQAILDDEELSAFLAVLSDYYELVANASILKFSKSYLEIAKENQSVAFANYTAGVNTIVDVMTANSLLNIARKQLADAKTNFLTALANLVYDTGGLDSCEINQNPGIRMFLE